MSKTEKIKLALTAVLESHVETERKLRTIEYLFELLAVAKKEECR